jgi:hypothetical protein
MFAGALRDQLNPFAMLSISAAPERAQGAISFNTFQPNPCRVASDGFRPLPPSHPEGLGMDIKERAQISRFQLPVKH